MLFEPKLETAIVEKRYKRFLADVIHPTLGSITVHCPNTGSMTNCWQANWTVWLQRSNNLKRKYPFTWVLAQNEQQEFICINTQVANQVVYEALKNNKIAEFPEINKIRTEVKYGKENSRIDFILERKNKKDLYLEVKSVTLKEKDGKGYFPDAVTVRGQKHIRELIDCVNDGFCATLFFMVQHTGIKQLNIAKHIDPDYEALITKAVNVGVKVIAYGSRINQNEIVLDQKIEVLI